VIHDGRVTTYFWRPHGFTFLCELTFRHVAEGLRYCSRVVIFEAAERVFEIKSDLIKVVGPAHRRVAENQEKRV
jgi:hypothetical protein